MEDPALNKSLEETKELHTRWNQFHEFARMAVERGHVTPEAEMKFLELKSIIAILHDGFMAKLDHSQKTGQNIMSIVGDSILLSRIARANEAERQKFEFDWNECYLLLSEQVQALEEQKNKLAGISKAAMRAQQRKERIQAIIHNFLHGSFLRWAFISAIAVVVLYVVPAYVWSYRNLRPIPVIGTKVYVPFVNFVYRPHWDSEYAYDKWEDISQSPPDYSRLPQVKQENANPLDEAYLKRSVLNELGMNAANAEKARQLLSGGDLLRFESERYTADGTDVRLFYLLFKTTAQAKQFVDLANESLALLDDAKRQAVTSSAFIGRSANFLAIGLSKHTMRFQHAQQRFKMDEATTPNELKTF